MTKLKGEHLMKIGYLKKDTLEMYNMKRTRFINSWRIVDENGKDMALPWPRTKTEARRLAVHLGIKLKEK
jgi:hypothetical protein